MNVASQAESLESVRRGVKRSARRSDGAAAREASSCR